MRKAILALAFLSGGSNALLLSSDNTTESSSFFGYVKKLVRSS